ncbi:MAG: GFA family protein [Pseudomonadota bacterium]
MTEEYSGSCQCGAIGYTFKGPLPAAYACHCGECKKQSASAFSISLPMTIDRLEIEGNPAVFESKAYSGKPKYNYFCPDCGTRLWHSGTFPPDQITLKVGTLDKGTDISPIGHLWVSKKQAGILLDPDSEQHDTQPSDLAVWRNNLGKDS